MKYEYFTVHRTDTDGTIGSKMEEIWLNEMGDSGWELVSVVPLNHYTRTYYFKRLNNNKNKKHGSSITTRMET